MMWVLLAALIGGAWYGLTIYLDHWYLINIDTEEAIEGFAILLYSWPILVFVFLLSMLFLPWAFKAHNHVAKAIDKRTIKRLESELKLAIYNEKSADTRAQSEARSTLSQAREEIAHQAHDIALKERAVIEREGLAEVRIEQARADTLAAEQSVLDALVKKRHAQGAAARLMKKRHKTSNQ